MAEDRQSFSIKEDKSGTVHVAGEVVAIIAGRQLYGRKYYK